MIRSISADILHRETTSMNKIEDYLRELQLWSRSLQNYLSEREDAMSHMQAEQTPSYSRALYLLK